MASPLNRIGPLTRWHKRNPLNVDSRDIKPPSLLNRSPLPSPQPKRSSFPTVFPFFLQFSSSLFHQATRNFPLTTISTSRIEAIRKSADRLMIQRKRKNPGFRGEARERELIIIKKECVRFGLIDRRKRNRIESSRVESSGMEEEGRRAGSSNSRANFNYFSR